jgi:hypothetical protein
MVEMNHQLDTQEVTGSSPVPPIGSDEKVGRSFGNEPGRDGWVRSVTDRPIAPRRPKAAAGFSGPLRTTPATYTRAQT